MAEGAALMTDTKLDTVMILGSAMDQHFSKSIAETMQKNIDRVGMPKWDNNDVTLAKALQKELGRPRGRARQHP
jgi:aminobenzoyl-glutamate utilization protein B